VSDKPIRCPRCGYELAQAVSDATARGDAAGNCSECGLEVRWALLRESGGDPRWFVESRTHPGRPRRRIARAVGTLAMCVRPRRFWSRVTMEIPADWRGMACFLALVALMAHLLLGARNVHTLATEGGGWIRLATPSGPSIGRAGSTQPLDYLAAIVVPLASVSVSEVTSEIRNAGAGEKTFRTVVAILEEPGLWPPAWLPNRAPNPDVLAGLDTPLRESHEPILSARALGRAAFAASVPVLAPLATVVLPISMRRARIRARHLVRGMVYGAALIVPLAALLFLTPRGMGIGGDVNAGTEVHSLLACSVVLTLLWNWAFSREYLRLSHPLAVALSNTAVVGLLSLLGASIAFGWV
jgi:hypothetical protein